MSAVERRVPARHGAASRRVVCVLVTILTGLTSLVGSASATDLNSRASQLKTQQAQVQQQLKSAQASDAQIQAAVATLDRIAAAQQQAAALARIQLSDAQNQVQLADQKVTVASTQLEKAKSDVASAQNHLRVQAINAYVNGGAVSSLNTLFASNPTQAELLTQYRATAAGSTRDAVDTLRQAQMELTLKRQALVAAQNQARSALTVASDRSRTADSAAALATSAADSQRNAHVVLQQRINNFNSESTSLAGQQAQISALIAQSAARSAGPSASPGQNSRAGLIWPVHGPVTSEYGPRWGGFHPGIDIGVPTGTPIHAAKSGQVIFAGWESGYGNFVLIDHGGGMVTGYAHQSQIASSQGENVSQGQVIGYVGSTGDSTGPHLHFEVRINGSTQNPRDYESGSP